MFDLNEVSGADSEMEEVPAQPHLLSSSSPKVDTSLHLRTGGNQFHSHLGLAVDPLPLAPSHLLQAQRKVRQLRNDFITAPTGSGTRVFACMGVSPLSAQRPTGSTFRRRLSRAYARQREISPYYSHYNEPNFWKNINSRSYKAAANYFGVNSRLVPDEQIEGRVKPDHSNRVLNGDHRSIAMQKKSQMLKERNKNTKSGEGSCDGVEVVTLSSDTEENGTVLGRSAAENGTFNKRFTADSMGGGYTSGADETNSATTSTSRMRQILSLDLSLWNKSSHVTNPASHVGTSADGASLNERFAVANALEGLNQTTLPAGDFVARVQNAKKNGKQKPTEEVPIIRCVPTSPCSRCLAFFGRSVPLHMFVPPSKVAPPRGGHPPVLKNANKKSTKKRKQYRHWPKGNNSEFRGVTLHKRTSRWEAQIWHDGQQTYLGASATKEEAARAYDKAALLLTGPESVINFKREDYISEISHLYKLSKAQLTIYLRRNSRNCRAEASYPGVTHKKKNTFQAAYKPYVKKKALYIMGTMFPSKEEAARAIFKEALKRSNGELASRVMNTYHVLNFESTDTEYGLPPGPVFPTAKRRESQEKVTTSKRKAPAPKRKRSVRLKETPAVPNASTSAPSSAVIPVQYPHACQQRTDYCFRGKHNNTSRNDVTVGQRGIAAKTVLVNWNSTYLPFVSIFETARPLLASATQLVQPIITIRPFDYCTKAPTLLPIPASLVQTDLSLAPSATHGGDDESFSAPDSAPGSYLYTAGIFEQCTLSTVMTRVIRVGVNEKLLCGNQVQGA